MVAVRLASVLVVVLGVALPAAAQAPQPAGLVDTMIDAAGGREAFAAAGVLKLTVNNEETTNKGESHTNSVTAYVRTPDLEDMRLEFGDGVVVTKNGGGGWAFVGGALDPRPQTPRMARGTAHQQLFAALLPFSLRINEVQLRAVEKATWEGAEVWRLTIGFAPLFFTSPLINTDWQLYVSSTDHRILAIEVDPPQEFAGEATKESMRYRILKTQEVADVRLPSRVLTEGVTAKGVESGHFRITSSTAEPWAGDPDTLFVPPEE